MTGKPGKCPVCLDSHGATSNVTNVVGGWGWAVDCNVCGRYRITREVFDDELDPNRNDASKWTTLRRASLSHALRTRKNVAIGEHGLPEIHIDQLGQFRNSPLSLPTPPEQVTKIIGIIGDKFRETGSSVDQLGLAFYAKVGSRSPNEVEKLVLELASRGLVDCKNVSSFSGKATRDVSLTLSGWETWKANQCGENSSFFGVIAMKYKDKILDLFVEEVVKPAVKTIRGYKLERVDDNPRSGIIDMIMRQTIQESAFVLADLTHGNNGAYWEAGYAEGLGKPVIYLCEKDKFDREKTHFDTNHCTTIIWDKDKPEEFSKQLVAAIKNSLNIIN